MTKLKVYNQTGKPVGEVKLNAKIFGVELNPELVQQAVRTQNANSRIVIAHTKTRGEVRGGGKKPWKQKGTGRARHGSSRSPIWKGGGVTFGPRKDRNYSIKINKKAKRKALFMSLSAKASDTLITVVDKIDMPAIKTKEITTMIAKLNLNKSVLVVLPKSDAKIIKSIKNIPKVTAINANSLNIMDVLKYNNLLVLKDSLAVIDKTFLSE
ncbi:MAG: 50S ribosomal protein L4 [Candidatus Kerfeldbacteria bacterium]|jgi:large subunit ribosomal protein L4